MQHHPDRKNIALAEQFRGRGENLLKVGTGSHLAEQVDADKADRAVRGQQAPVVAAPQQVQSADGACERICCASLASAWQTMAANYQRGLAKHSPTCLTTRKAQPWPLKAMRS
ncbi:TPA: hypothetical protein ACH3X1_009790 [Trebouxia sp. C0004]